MDRTLNEDDLLFDPDGEDERFEEEEDEDQGVGYDEYEAQA